MPEEESRRRGWIPCGHARSRPLGRCPRRPRRCRARRAAARRPVRARRPAGRVRRLRRRPSAEGVLRPKGETVGGLRRRSGRRRGHDPGERRRSRTSSVRLIGMNTPETVKPDSPVECFGPESSDFAKPRSTGAHGHSGVRRTRRDGPTSTTGPSPMSGSSVPDGRRSLFNLRVDRRWLRVRAAVRPDAVRLEGPSSVRRSAGRQRCRRGPVGCLPGLLTLPEHGTHGDLTLRWHAGVSRHAARQRRDTMSDTTGSTPAEGTPDTTPTEALQLADQEPIAAAPAAPAPSPAAHAFGRQPHPHDPRGHRRSRGGRAHRHGGRSRVRGRARRPAGRRRPAGA